MKKTLLVVLIALALVALMVGTAFAQGSGNDPSGSNPNEPAAYPGYVLGDGTTYQSGSVYKAVTGSPHGGFTVDSQNCAVCHSVHHAASAGFALLPGYSVPTAGDYADAADGTCAYCHIETKIGYIQVYDGNVDNFVTATDNGHDAAGNARCVACHQVHAATDAMPDATDAPFLVEKILRVDGGNAPDAAFNGGGNEDQVSIWCTVCHQGYFSNGQAYNGTSHVMKAPETDYNSASTHGPAGQIANASSSTCRGCHNRGLTEQAPLALIAGYVEPNTLTNGGGSFPHFTDGARFLTEAKTLDANGAPLTTGGAASSHDDAVCYNCHRGAGADGTVVGGGVGVGW